MARIIVALICVSLCLASLVDAHGQHKRSQHEFKTFDHHSSHERGIPGHPKKHRPHLAQDEKLGANVVDIAEAVVGLLEGVGTTVSLNEVTGCIEDTESIWGDFSRAVTDFK